MQQNAPHDGELGGLPAFARLLASRPHADEIVRGLIEGPLAAYGAFAGVLMWMREPSLRTLGLHGYPAHEVEGFEELPLAADLPITRAAREGEVIIGSGDSLESEYADAPVDDPRWERHRERVRVGAIVGVPVIARGRTVGAYVFTCDRERTWQSIDIALLDTLGRMIGMWMLSPDSQLPSPGTEPSDVQLTERQGRILSLVLAGKTNATIAATLGYSESTVKQEISRVMRSLGCSTRTAAAERAASLGLVSKAAP